MTATDFAKPALGGARILVAEGDPDDSVALTAVLRLNGFDAREARTEEDALRAATENRPAVLVLDLDLPGDGCGFIRRVRRLPDPPAVVVVTAHTGQGVRRAAAEAGAAAYLLKPADPAELAKVVAGLCRA